MNATLPSLSAWINAKPLIRPASFASRQDYMRAARLASRQRRDGIRLLAYMAARPAIVVPAVPPHNRLSACQLMADAIKEHAAKALPEPSGYRVETIAGYDSSPVLTLSAASRLASEDAASYVFPVYRARKGKRAVTADGYLRWHFRRMLGNGITARYFS